VDIGWLESFLALVEHGSFTRAAEAQHISQPAFSRRIRALELWFGEELVDRSTFPVALTPAGTKVRASAVQTVASLASARDEVRGRRRTPHDAVRVSVTHTLATTFFTEWWARCSDERPIPCVLLPSNTLDGYDALLHGGCDLLLAYADPAHPPSLPESDVEWIVVATDRLAPFSSVTGERVAFTLPGAQGSPVPMVTHGAGAFLGRITDRILHERHLLVSPVVQSDLTSALAAFVSAGIGVGWLPELLAAPGVAEGRLRRLGDASLSALLEIRLYRVRQERISPLAAKIWHGATELASTRVAEALPHDRVGQ
jgi:LysR family transcriptional regulator, hypochlorite-specific transcription factor HypT